MVDVNLWAGLRRFADGNEVVTVQGDTVGEVLTALVAAHPGLKEPVEAGVSVAIDGRIIASGLSEPVAPDSEVYLLQRLKGG